MAFFSPKTWKQRIVEFPGRRRLDDTSTADVYDVSRAEGNVMQEGDGFTASNMNDLEQRIYSAVNEIEKKIGTKKTASDISYNNESSGLTAQTAQEAIDENAADIKAINARTNVLKIYFGVSAVGFNSGVGWLAYPQELWKYTSEPIVLANLYLQSGQNTGVNVYTGNTLTDNRRVEFYIDPSITRNIYVSYIFALRN